MDKLLCFPFYMRDVNQVDVTSCDIIYKCEPCKSKIYEKNVLSGSGIEIFVHTFRTDFPRIFPSQTLNLFPFFDFIPRFRHATYNHILLLP